MRKVVFNIFALSVFAAMIITYAAGAKQSGKARSAPLEISAMHQFVITEIEKAQALSIQYDREFCGFIGYTQSGQLTMTQPVKGRKSGCRLSGKSRRFKVIASYHTHGAYTPLADTEVPSVNDLKHDFKQGMHGYVATPGGRIWFNDKAKKTTTLLCGPGCIETDRNYRECPSVAPKTRYTIKSLKWREKNVNEPCE